jgi:hypothetical protein
MTDGRWPTLTSKSHEVISASLIIVHQPMEVGHRPSAIGHRCNKGAQKKLFLPTTTLP